MRLPQTKAWWNARQLCFHGLKKSFYIGDKDADMFCAHNAGVLHSSFLPVTAKQLKKKLVNGRWVDLSLFQKISLPPSKSFSQELQGIQPLGMPGIWCSRKSFKMRQSLSEFLLMNCLSL